MRSNFMANRRGFLKASVVGGLAAGVAGRVTPWAAAAEVQPAKAAIAAAPASRVAVTAGDSRPDNVLRGLKTFQKEIAAAIGNRRVIVKPNNVAITTPLCATHADCIEAILEFLKSIGKLEQTIIAESAAGGPTLDGFANYGYNKVAGKYKVKMVDLDQQPVTLLRFVDEKDFRPHAARMSSMMLDPDNFLISATRTKTHDRVVTTLSLKNIVVGAPIKDAGFAWGPGAKPGAKNDKPIVHGSGYRAINFNLFQLAQRLHPHLSVIDGFEGMEGNGPVSGTPADHRVSVVGMDWLAADRVALELMGIDFAKVGYLNFCAEAGLGQADLKKIEIVGEPIAKHVKTYKLADSLPKQLIWQQPV